MKQKVAEMKVSKIERLVRKFLYPIVVLAIFAAYATWHMWGWYQQLEEKERSLNERELQLVKREAKARSKDALIMDLKSKLAAASEKARDAEESSNSSLRREAFHEEMAKYMENPISCGPDLTIVRENRISQLSALEALARTYDMRKELDGFFQRERKQIEKIFMRCVRSSPMTAPAQKPEEAIQQRR